MGEGTTLEDGVQHRMGPEYWRVDIKTTGYPQANQGSYYFLDEDLAWEWMTRFNSTMVNQGMGSGPLRAWPPSKDHEGGRQWEKDRLWQEVCRIEREKEVQGRKALAC